ncbi:MAG TPA: endonuclease domain-containing protein [Thermoanaerobaculia bacterium]|jgi:very-short-patch-repair endonuclease|nr:endonuclease domain-containing protein [Thermoanaerobaculia bacterium]
MPLSSTAERRERARGLRKAQTSAEAVLWAALRNRRLAGLKFRRQVAIDRYVLDFYCHEPQLVVELDGEVHGEPRQRDHDQSRDSYLTSRGLRVLRIANREVFEDLDGVLRRIVKAGLREALTPDPSPSPPPALPGRGEPGR